MVHERLLCCCPCLLVLVSWGCWRGRSDEPRVGSQSSPHRADRRRCSQRRRSSRAESLPPSHDW